jgi:hypothetical protein
MRNMWSSCEEFSLPASGTFPTNRPDRRRAYRRSRGVGVAVPVAVVPTGGQTRPVPCPPQLVRAARPLGEPQRRAIERPQEVHVHHYWHNVSAEDVAAIIREQQEDR